MEYTGFSKGKDLQFINLEETRLLEFWTRRRTNLRSFVVGCFYACVISFVIIK